MVDLQTQYAHIKEEIHTAIQQVLNSAHFINGPEVKQFAAELADYLGCKHVIPCANGTDALQIGMMALDLQAGDEVIVPVHTYVATAEAIALLKLTPVFVDVDPDDFTIDVNQIEALITPKTKLIVPVHLYGQCANMEAIMQIAEKHGLFVMEDTAQAIGADCFFADGSTQKAGTVGHIGTTSFFPSKNLGCFGDGGALITNDDELAKKIYMMANHGQSVKYKHDSIGCNSRLDTIQAAVLRVKLPHLDTYNAARNTAADYYDAKLSGIDGIQIPKRTSWSNHVFHQYTIRLTKGNRNEVQKILAEQGIPSMIYYPIPLHFQEAYRMERFGKGSFPVTEMLSEQVLSLPIHSEMNTEIQNEIIHALIKSTQ
ncbi:DegT/DnrJ/EryC1/StrS family aminotransferase [bacterium]|nr:MAG: DegT/DnrJ/EryC1/StrS family aminotransferase [bacterium]